MPLAANLNDLTAMNAVIRKCVSNRPVTDRIKKLTLPSLLLEETDFNFMDIWVAGDPIVGVIALQGTKEGMLLHSLYVDPKASGNGIGTELVNQAVKLTKEAGQERLLVKAFAESVRFFQKVGFEPTDVLDYPHTFGMSL
jgi:N-acetylglutamate synthase-like GNAT family acetyltransferase